MNSTIIRNKKIFFSKNFSFISYIKKLSKLLKKKNLKYECFIFMYLLRI